MHTFVKAILDWSELFGNRTEAKMKTDDREWKDVTGECEAKIESAGIADFYCVSFYYQGRCIASYFNNDLSVEYRDDFRITNGPGGYVGFRIEKLVEKSFVWTYTPEYVASLDYKNMTTAQLLEHCVKAHDEKIAAKKVGAMESERDFRDHYRANTCPTCVKNKPDPAGTICVLAGRTGDICNAGPNCCNGLWVKAINSHSLSDMQAVRDFIEMRRLEEVAKETKWEPKVGDKVRTKFTPPHESDYTATIIKAWGTATYDWLLFNPNWTHGHGGGDEGVAGFPRSHFLAKTIDLSPLRDEKKWIICSNE